MLWTRYWLPSRTTGPIHFVASGCVLKVLDDRQLLRTCRIGRIPRVIGRELDQVIGMLLAHFLEHAARRHVRRGHGLGDEVVFAGVMLHQWADAGADVVPNGQIELQSQLRLLIGELFGVPTNREIGSPGDKPEEQDGECHHNQQELRANALHEAVRGRFRFAFVSHAGWTAPAVDARGLRCRLLKHRSHIYGRTSVLTHVPDDTATTIPTDFLSLQIASRLWD